MAQVEGMTRWSLLLMLLAGLLYNVLPVAALAHAGPAAAVAVVEGAGGSGHVHSHDGSGRDAAPCKGACASHVTHASCVACHALPAMMPAAWGPPQAPGRPAEGLRVAMAGRAPPVLVPPPRG